jgi:hypothetical protein
LRGVRDNDSYYPMEHLRLLRGGQMSNNNPFEDAARSIKSQNREVVYSDSELQHTNAIGQAIDRLQDTANIFAVTDLTDTQVMLFSQAETLGEFWDIPEYDQILRGMATMLLSRGRKSRAEIIQMTGGLTKKKTAGERIKAAGDALADKNQGGNQ